MNRILGAGLACVDIIYDNNNDNNKIEFQNGGTCANVLSVLAQLGWDAEILKPRYADFFDTFLNETFCNLNVKCMYYKYSKKTTPRVIELLNQRKHIFKTCCPSCARKITSLDMPSVNDIEKLDLFYKDYALFFHDRVSPGVNQIIAEMKKNRKVVMYEPNGFRNAKIFMNHCKKCDIVKFSGSQVPMEIAERIRIDAYNNETKIIINTNGENGLVFAHRKKNGLMTSWQRIPPFTSRQVFDTSGAGDWFTAGFLDKLLRKFSILPTGIEEEFIVACIEEGKRNAKICCTSLGAQGAFYSNTQIKKLRMNATAIMSSYPSKIAIKTENNYCTKCFLEL
ncbi:MAG: PfkB family carbohydrate kinase [Candidatus Peribacteria bacterium]|jgi:fructokinase|nr:PfkB family carbohydrate kinase [Candidatus Peribacteria bacterium]